MTQGASRPVLRVPRLAAWATVGRAVHERVPPDWRAAPAAGLPGPAVGFQGPLEVPALPVHVNVEAVEGRAADLERLSQDAGHGLEETAHLGGAQGVGRLVPVQTGPPQRLIGVDV